MASSNTHKSFKRKSVLIVCIILTVCIAVSSTLAYIVVKTDLLSNIFTPAETSISVNGTTVTNDGEVKVYVRMTPVVTLRSGTDDNIYYGGVSFVEGTDYTISEPDTLTAWEKGSDGYYYCSTPIAKDGSVTVPSFTATLTDAAKDKIPTGYQAVVQYLVSAIQAEPTDAVTESWGGEVDANGSYTPA